MSISTRAEYTVPIPIKIPAYVPTYVPLIDTTVLITILSELGFISLVSFSLCFQLWCTMDPNHPVKNANFLSTSCFCWTIPTFFKGYMKSLEQSDLPGTLSSHESKILGDKLEKMWTEEVKLSQKPCLKKTFRRIFGIEFYGLVALLCLIELVTKLSLPLYIGKLIHFYTPNQDTITKNDAILYSFLVIFGSFTTVLLGHNYMMANQHLGMKIRIACCSLIYRKCLKLSKCGVADVSVEELVNILEDDVSKFDRMFLHTHNFWIAPLQILLVVCWLYVLLGYHALMGMVIFVGFIPFQIYLTKLTSKLKLKTSIRTNTRLRLMREILRGIRVIKIYAWEALFLRLIFVARKWEIKQLKSASYVRALQITFSLFLSRSAVFISILTYIAFGNTPNAYYVFVLTSFYTAVKQSLLFHLPNAITALGEAHSSIRRIEDFLMKEEVVGDHVKPIMEFMSLSRCTLKSIGILCQEVSAKWNPFLDKFVLRNVDFTVHRGALIALIGKSGCGKTSFLQTILKEMPLIKGEIYINGTISYSSQDPWIFSGTIRDNIIFGNKFDEKRYNEVFKACALDEDFSLLSHDDLIPVGEKGAILTTGQKNRINLARAVYREADIYLLDNPLNGNETKISWMVFKRCIMGFLSGKTVVFVTRKLKFLNEIKEVYALENGCIEKCANINGDYDLEEETVEDIPNLTAKPFSSRNFLDLNETTDDNTITFDVYKHYIKCSGGLFTTLVMAILFILTQFFASSSDYFLTFWVNLEQDKNQTVSSPKSTLTEYFLDTNKCFYFFLLSILLLIFFSVTTSLIFTKFAMRASEILHNYMFFSVISAEMRFFNVNTFCSILRRFSNDIRIIDNQLHVSIIEAVQSLVASFFIVSIIASINIWMIIPTLVMAIIFYWLKMFYTASSKNVKKLESLTRTPVFSHLSTTMLGISTIRASDEIENMKQIFDTKQNEHSSAYFMLLALNRTFGFWLDLHCVLYVALVTISFLLIINENHPGNVGLALTQAINLTMNLQWGIRRWSDMENNMLSTKQIKMFSELEQEFKNDLNLSVKKGWSRLGKIEFRNVYLRYSPEIFPVLHDVSFVVKQKEKVCVIGRPGVGKSSLISAILRLAETQGSILIDNIDIKTVPLHELRQRISIIPQNPTLFSGTIKTNLDPFNCYNEYELWAALEHVELHDFVKNSPLGLHTQVLEGGWSINVGQRQLLCLAKAILRKNKILILDEIRTNLDLKTRNLIVSILRKKFGECTVFIIAHRMASFEDFNKVMIIHDGRLIFCDHPNELDDNSNTMIQELLTEFKSSHKKGCCK